MLDPAQAPMLIQITVEDRDVVDAVTDEGCTDLGLPVTYPVDETGHEVCWGRCQPIGRNAWESGEAGMVCRSAATHDRTGEQLALFRRAGDHALRVDLGVRRLVSVTNNHST
jgi:hypothetical protein